MKFETKYLIRWGIPGWVFSTWIIIAAFGTIEPLTALIKETDFIKILGILITLLSIGVPIGYLFHQIYFSWQWLDKRKKKNTTETGSSTDTKDILKPIKDKIEGYNEKGDFYENYFYIEFLWHKLLLNLEQEKRDYIISRYRYFLSTIHGLGSLMYSLATSFFIILFFFILGIVDGWKEVMGIILILVAHCLLFCGTLKNYKYYSKNLIVFQANFFEEMLKAEKESSEGKNSSEQVINIKLHY